MNIQFELGKELGRKHFNHIITKSHRWKNRNIPVSIREYLMVPYYITENNSGISELYIIQQPVGKDDKVHFIRFASADEKENSTKISAGTE